MGNEKPKGDAARPSLYMVGAAFVRYGNFTFGGGSSTIATLHEEIVARRRWISEDQFHLAYALSRLTPGTNVLAFCAAAGGMIRGFAGAVVALVAASVPCSTIAVLVTHFYSVLQSSPIFKEALRGALAAAVAVMINTAWVLSRPYAQTSIFKAVFIVSAAIALANIFSLSAFHILLLAGAVGALWPAQIDSKE